MFTQALLCQWLGLSRYQIWKTIVHSNFCHAASHSIMSFAVQQHIRWRWLLMNHTTSSGTSLLPLWCNRYSDSLGMIYVDACLVQSKTKQKG